MSRASLLIVIGVLAILAPFSGLPGAVRSLLAIVLGALVVGIGIALRSREQRRLVALQSATPVPTPAPLPPVIDVPAAPLSPLSTPVFESQPGAVTAPTDVPPRKPRARKPAPKTMSPI